MRGEQNFPTLMAKVVGAGYLCTSLGIVAILYLGLVSFVSALFFCCCIIYLSFLCVKDHSVGGSLEAQSIRAGESCRRTTGTGVSVIV